jgi:hypothetical protein
MRIYTLLCGVILQTLSKHVNTRGFLLKISSYHNPPNRFDIQDGPCGSDPQCKGFLREAGKGENRERQFDERLSGRTKKWVAESGGITRERVPIVIGRGRPGWA